MTGPAAPSSWPAPSGYTSAADLTPSVSRANVAYGARMYLAPPNSTAAVSCTVSAGLTDTPATTGLEPATAA